MCATQSPFWQWHRLGRPCRGVARRVVYRYLADEPDPTGQHCRSGCNGTSRRYHEQLNEHLHDTGLFFSVDPGANAAIGGMAATRASGTTAVRYGTMPENVLSLIVVLPDGRVIRTARRVRKSAAGYDLTRFFVGSDGTLGLITEVVLLSDIPSALSVATCSFPSIEAAVNTVIQTIQAGIPMVRIELAHADALNSIIRHSKLDLPVALILRMEFHGTENAVAEQAEMVQRIAADHGGANFSWTTRPEDRQKRWRARDDAYYANKATYPGTNICATMSAYRFRGWPNASPGSGRAVRVNSAP
jgi:D-lactate dehydrogenase (cytochrome)